MPLLLLHLPSLTLPDHDDPFREARAKCPILVAQHQGETIPMILRHKDVRR